jgi:hypothetical protein
MIKIRALLLVCCLILASFATTAAQDAPPECPGTLPGRLSDAAYARVLPGLANNLRAEPSAAAELLARLPPHAVVAVYGDPVCAEGHLWWNVGYPTRNDLVGWTAEGDSSEYWIEPYIHPQPEFLLRPIDIDGLEAVDVAYGGISFSLDPALVESVQLERVFPKIIPVSMRSPSAGNPVPDGLRFVIADPTGRSNGIVIEVYEVTEFAKLPDGLPDSIVTLQDILASADTGIIAAPIEFEQMIAPGWTAPLLFQDAFRVLDFQNGRGVSYFAEYSFSAEPITSLTYIFAGLTDDRDYYVTLRLPVTTGLLPDIDTEDFDQDDWEAFYDGFSDYYLGIVDTLRAASPDDFTPDLDMIDAVIASINIEAPQD